MVCFLNIPNIINIIGNDFFSLKIVNSGGDSDENDDNESDDDDDGDDESNGVIFETHISVRHIDLNEIHEEGLIDCLQTIFPKSSTINRELPTALGGGFHRVLRFPPLPTTGLSRISHTLHKCDEKRISEFQPSTILNGSIDVFFGTFRSVRRVVYNTHPEAVTSW